MLETAGVHGQADREGGVTARIRWALADVGAFSEAVLGLPLREYQLEVARAVVESISERRGLAFTVLMAYRIVSPRDRRGPRLDDPDASAITTPSA